MQSLALDVKPMREDGPGMEIAEEDDELLRAAEELGVDLSPERLRVHAARPGRAGGGDRASTEIDLEGELHVAADEQLTEVTSSTTRTRRAGRRRTAAAPSSSISEPAEEVEVEE